MVSLLSIFFIKQIEYIPSIFDIHYSIFDILFFYVSFLIRLAVFLASGGVCVKLPMKLLLPQTRTTDPQEQSNDERRYTESGFA